MFQSWLPAVEQIMFAAIDSKARVLGILSHDSGAGVSTLSRMMAESHSQSGLKSLLVDLSQDVAEHSDDEDDWTPGNGPQQLIQRDTRGYDVLKVRPTSRTRPMFNNVDALRRTLAEHLAAYQSIVVDLPPVLDQRGNRLNPMASARACDAVIMVCVPNQVTHGRLNDALEALGTAGIKLGGTVINDRACLTLGQQLASRANQLLRYSPRLASWLDQRLRSSVFLNMRS